MARMGSKERVLTAFARCAPDRVPINYSGNPGIEARLKAHFGLRADDWEGLQQALQVDFRSIYPAYTGPKLHPDIPERGVRVNDWGVRRVWVEHSSGGYWDYCDFPLEHATEEEVANWPMMSPDDFDYSAVGATCKQRAKYALYFGHPGLPDIINGNGMLRGMEQTLVDLVTDEPAGLLLAQRRSEIQLEIMRRTLEAAQGGIDFVWMGEDVGTQRGPTISPETFRKHIRRLHQPFIDLARSYNLPVMMHCCGSSSWAFNDFSAMGVSVVDTLQPEAANMAPAYLKKTYGDRLAFHGCISTAGPLAYGSVDEVVANCRQTLEIMMPGGGYCFAPTHAIQDNSPTENVLAAYRTAVECGWYR